MIASASSADPLDRVDLVVDQDAEPVDVDALLDALDKIVTRRLQQRYQSETGNPAKVARFLIPSPSTSPSQEATACPNQV